MGGVTLASSRGTLNTPDWKDVAEALASFEEMDGLEIITVMRRATTGKTKDIRITVSAYRIGDYELGATALAFVSATCLATNRLTLDAALLALLYQLDFKLALNEFPEAKVK